MRKAFQMSGLFYDIYIVVSLFASLFCYLRIGVDGKPIFFLPLSYAIVLAICRNLRKVFGSLSVIIINTVCLVRYAIYPITLVNGDYYFYSDEAVILMIYELVVVLLFLNFYSKRISRLRGMASDASKSNELGLVNIMLVLATVLCGLLFPSLLSIFIFYGGEAESVSISGVISITFSLGIMIIYSCILSKLGNLKGGGGFALFVSILFALFYIAITSISETNVHRWKFLSVGIPTIYILVSSFPKHRKSIISFAIIALPLSVFFGSFVKFAISDMSISSFSNIFLTSESIGAYFGGIDEISNALSILRGNSQAESFMSTMTDIFGNMPVISHSFNTDDYSTQALYLDGLGRTDQICPLVAQSVIHFGIIGAPVLSIIMTIIAVEGERFSKSAKSVYSLYGSIMLCVTFSLFMCLNTTILLPNLWKLLIFLILQYLNERYFLHAKTVNHRTHI